MDKETKKELDRKWREDNPDRWRELSRNNTKKYLAKKRERMAEAELFECMTCDKVITYDEIKKGVCGGHQLKQPVDPRKEAEWRRRFTR